MPREWNLVVKATGKPVVVNDIVMSDDHSQFRVKGLRPPHKSSSSGFVSGYWLEDGPGKFDQEYYVTVFNLEWRKEE